MSVARFIADQRTFYRVPHAVTCAILGVSISWLYKWLHREPTARQGRRAALDKRVRELFERSKRTYGSPRAHADLLAEGWRVSVNTVADSMRRQGLQGRKPKRRNGLTKQDKKAPKFPDLLRRDFSASVPNRKWCGDITEIPTDEGKLYLASVLDLCGRRLLACPMSEHPDAELAGDAIKMATAVRGGKNTIDGVIFHSDRGSTYTAMISLHCVCDLGSGNRWGESGRASITPPRRRSSLRWSMRCSRGTTSLPRPRLVPSSRPGATISTTLNVGTARPGCCHQLSTKRSLPSNRRPHKGRLHDLGGSPILLKVNGSHVVSELG
ncbi:IS3 family transposase [Mycobacterium sp.]|uniref:IS3 family transposase n=1 Tax=Mycobacterium sp. TaxID=1785 RepID=UPI003C761106